MLLGKPVIATGWSGNMSVMDQDSAALVGDRPEPSINPRGVYARSMWAEPETAGAVRQLRRLADDAAARATLGVRGRTIASARLGGEMLAASMRRIGLPARERRSTVTSRLCRTAGVRPAQLDPLADASLGIGLGGGEFRLVGTELLAALRPLDPLAVV